MLRKHDKTFHAALGSLSAFKTLEDIGKKVAHFVNHTDLEYRDFCRGVSFVPEHPIGLILPRICLHILSANDGLQDKGKMALKRLTLVSI